MLPTDYTGSIVEAGKMGKLAVGMASGESSRVPANSDRVAVDYAALMTSSKSSREEGLPLPNWRT